MPAGKKADATDKDKEKESKKKVRIMRFVALRCFEGQWILGGVTFSYMFNWKVVPQSHDSDSLVRIVSFDLRNRNSPVVLAWVISLRRHSSDHD